MGKPYQLELESLPQVYDWAMTVDVRLLVSIVGGLAPQPLLAVGSGGSFTAAAVASYLHQRYAQKLARAVTPMEAVSLPTLHDAGVLITTSGGRNPDVLGAFQRLVEREPMQLAVLCATAATPLAELVASYWHTHLYEFSPPSGKDGFIATNSLIATVVLLVRAYQELYGDEQPLPNRWSGLWRGGQSDDALHLVGQAAGAVSAFDSLLVLYGPIGAAAALDLESKCSETGLANIQLADYRNFAHGRHHGLNVRSSNTAVVAIITDEDRDLATKTLSLLPREIVVSSIDVPGHSGRALIAALLSVITWVGFRGRERQVDPGRPSVAPFGRKLYHLRSFRTFGVEPPSPRALAIERKTKMSIERLKAAGSANRWDAAVDAAAKRYARTRFRSIVFDYDGTLCPPNRRYKGVHRDMARALEKLLQQGLLIGVATGRGKSVREDLAAHIPREYRERVWIGYYNGAQIAHLADDATPSKALPVHADLEQLASRVEADERLSSLMELDRSSSQITVFPKAFREDDVWQALQELCCESNHSVVRSTHSFDVLAPGVSKRNVLMKIADLLGATAETSILRIGDLGRWPGNDYELLADEFGLSVDQVSIHPAQCWNFAPAGHRGTQATLDYLSALTAHDETAALDLHNLGIGFTE